MLYRLSTAEAVDLLVKDDYARWTFEGARALIEYIEEADPNTIFDRVAIRCEFTEYESALEACLEYHGGSCPFDNEAAALDFLEDKTLVIQHEKGVIIHQF